MKLFRSFAIVSSLLLLAVPVFVQAHGAIFTFKHIDGPNMVLVTHNVHDAASGIPITYNLRVYTMDGQLVPFQTVQSAIKQGTKPVAYQAVQASEYLDANVVHTYPQRGAYTLSLTFLNRGKVVAQADFPIAVAKGIEPAVGDIITIQSGLILLLGAVLATAWLKRTVILKVFRSIIARRKRQ